MFLILHLNRSHPRSVSASSHRPFSAKHTMTPSPPGSERSASARIRPASARPRPASARPRPTSARITYSSHKDYLVNTACRDIPRSPSQSSISRKVGETKTSQLRLGLRKKTADSWMLEESRQYLGRKPEDFKQPKRNDLVLLFKPISGYHWKCPEFHTIICKCTQMEKCNLDFKHINDNDNNNDDKTAILWFRFYHIQVRMTGLWTISDFHFSDNSNCINFGLVLRLTNFYLEFGHYSKETSDGIWGNYWHAFFLTPPGRKSKSKKLGLFIIVST